MRCPSCGCVVNKIFADTVTSELVCTNCSLDFGDTNFDGDMDYGLSPIMPNSIDGDILEPSMMDEMEEWYREDCGNGYEEDLV